MYGDKVPSGLTLSECQNVGDDKRELERVLAQYRNLVNWIEDQAGGAEHLVHRALGPQPQQACGSSDKQPTQEGLVGEFDDTRRAAEAAMARLQDALGQLNSVL